MIFEEQSARKPDHYSWTRDYIDAMWSGHWTPNEFNFKSDVQDFKTELTEQEQTIVVKDLSLIGQIEIGVKKFWANLGNNCPHPSLTDLGLTMASIEVIHNMAYEKLLDVLQLNDVFQENLKLDIIRGRVNYLNKFNKRIYADNYKQYVYSLILFTLFVENVSLFSQFYVISWFSRFKNVLKDASQQVKYTRLEESIHAQAGIKIIQTIREEHPELFDEGLEELVVSEIRNAYRYEEEIIDWLLGDYEQENLSSAILKAYIANRINESMKQLGMNLVLDVDHEALEKTHWMNEETIGNIQTDFFYRRPVDYAKSHQVFDEEEIFS